MQEIPFEERPDQTPDQTIVTTPPAPTVENPYATDSAYYQADETDDPTLSWMASEFIAHQKTNIWYIAMAGGALLVAIICYFITRDIVTTSVVVIAAIVLSIFAARKPRQIQYKANRQGLLIANKFYAMHAFRAFSVVPEGAFSSIILLPTNRFAIPVTLYFDPNDEQQLTDLLGNQLPMTPYKHDIIEQILRKIRF